MLTIPIVPPSDLGILASFSKPLIELLSVVFGVGVALDPQPAARAAIDIIAPVDAVFMAFSSSSW
jgi:hypothetical protein